MVDRVHSFESCFHEQRTAALERSSRGSFLESLLRESAACFVFEADRGDCHL